MKEKEFSYLILQMCKKETTDAHKIVLADGNTLNAGQTTLF